VPRGTAAPSSRKVPLHHRYKTKHRGGNSLPTGNRTSKTYREKTRVEGTNTARSKRTQDQHAASSKLDLKKASKLLVEKTGLRRLKREKGTRRKHQLRNAQRERAGGRTSNKSVVPGLSQTTRGVTKKKKYTAKTGDDEVAVPVAGEDDYRHQRVQPYINLRPTFPDGVGRRLVLEGTKKQACKRCQGENSE